jgi:2-deoxy-D-gluconate 3-dehydrogenase
MAASLWVSGVVEVTFLDLSNRRALVTGAAGDLGFAVLEGLLECGASAVGLDLSDTVKDRLEPLLKQGLPVHSVRADVTDRQSVEQVIGLVERQLGGHVEILVNSAGIQRRAPTEHFSNEDWDEVLAVNLTSAFLYSRAVAPRMLETGWGRIINIGSIMSNFGGVNIPAYAASKGGIAQLTKAMSNDWARRGVTVNAVAPGYMATQLNTALFDDELRCNEIMTRTTVGRWGEPSDLKGLCALLASESSSFITGAIIPVDGGYSAR